MYRESQGGGCIKGIEKSNETRLGKTLFGQQRPFQ